MNDTLKAAWRIGAELGAAKTENEKLRKALKRIIDRCEAFVDDEAEMRTPSVEVLMGIAEDAIYTMHEADVALSQQPEPTDTYTAVDMATAAAQGFRDGQAAVEQAPVQDEREDRDSQQRVCIAEMEKANQLRAEVETLRKDAERYRWASSGVHEAETLVSIVNCHGGYAEKVAERVDVYREAAMAAKEA